jgi:hypothetical protein
MRLSGVLMCGAVLLLFVGNVRSADDPMTIVDKAIKANGGEEGLSNFKAEQWKTKGAMHMLGMKIPYTGDFYFQSPNLFRFDLIVEIGNQQMTITAGTDGKISWEKMNPQPGDGDKGMVRDMEKKKAGAFLHNLYTMSLSHLLPLKNKEVTLALADEIKIDDKPAVGVKVSNKGHADVTLWFDKATGLLVKSQTQIWDEFSDKEVSQEVFMIDYQKKDGRQLFNKLVIKRDGKTLMEEEMSDQKALEKHDPSLFAKPVSQEKKP